MTKFAIRCKIKGSFNKMNLSAKKALKKLNSNIVKIKSTDMLFSKITYLSNYLKIVLLQIFPFYDEEVLMQMR